MKRDFELIRKMVLMIESEDHVWRHEELNIPEYSDDQIAYHAYLLVDAGFAIGQDSTQANSKVVQYDIFHLTWAGHEFADAVRDESRWKKVIEQIKGKSEGITLAVLTQLLIAVMKMAVGLN